MPSFASGSKTQISAAFIIWFVLQVSATACQQAEYKPLPANIDGGAGASSLMLGTGGSAQGGAPIGMGQGANGSGPVGGGQIGSSGAGAGGSVVVRQPDVLANGITDPADPSSSFSDLLYLGINKSSLSVVGSSGSGLSVYFITSISISSPSAGAVSNQEKYGRIVGLASDDSYIYYCASGAIYEMAFGTATAVKFEEPPSGLPSAVAVNSDTVFWINGGRIFSKKKSAGSSGPISSSAFTDDSNSGGTETLTADESFVYASSSNGIASVSIAGGSIVILAPAPHDPWVGFTSDANYIYWISASPDGSSTWIINAVAKQGGAVAQIATFTGNQPHSMANDANNFYWTSNISGTGIIMRLQK